MFLNCLHVEKGRKVLDFKESFRQDDRFAIINHIELALIDDGLLEALDGMEVVTQILGDILNALLKGFLDLNVVLAAEVDVFGLFEKMCHYYFFDLYICIHPRIIICSTKLLFNAFYKKIVMKYHVKFSEVYTIPSFIEWRVDFKFP